MKKNDIKFSNEDAQALFDSTRGSYILGKALIIAARVVEYGDPNEREPSVAADMKLLATLFLCLTDPTTYDGRVVGGNIEGEQK